MWHQRRRRRLGVKTKHRKALLRNLVRGLAFSRRIVTTHARAKETSRFADQMVTLAKEGTLASRRQLIRRLGSPDVAKIFMEEIAPRLQDRQGGYTRVLKIAFPRPGDGALKALVEFSVPIERPGKKEKKPKKEKKAKAPAERPSEKPPQAEKKPEKKLEKEKPEKPAEAAEKEETEKRGGFLTRLRKFLTGD